MCTKRKRRQVCIVVLLEKTFSTSNSLLLFPTRLFCGLKYTSRLGQQLHFPKIKDCLGKKFLYPPPRVPTPSWVQSQFHFLFFKEIALCMYENSIFSPANPALSAGYRYEGKYVMDWGRDRRGWIQGKRKGFPEWEEEEEEEEQTRHVEIPPPKK